MYLTQPDQFNSDVQLHESMRIVSELCAQHHFRGYQFSATSLPLTFGEWQQHLNFSLRSGLLLSLSPLMSDIESHPEIRLKSRRPVWLEGLQQEEVSTRQKWSEEWATSDVTNHSLVVDSSFAPPGFDLRRRLWSTMNHFRTGQGR